MPSKGMRRNRNTKMRRKGEKGVISKTGDKGEKGSTGFQGDNGTKEDEGTEEPKGILEKQLLVEIRDRGEKGVSGTV